MKQNGATLIRQVVYLISKLLYLMVPQVMEAPLADGVYDEGQLVVSLLPQLAHLPVAPDIASDLGPGEMLAENMFH